eukprot:scaffold4985_cov116-Isochrysis_galbana.AAC.3
MLCGQCQCPLDTRARAGAGVPKPNVACGPSIYCHHPATNMHMAPHLLPQLGHTTMCARTHMGISCVIMMYHVLYDSCERVVVASPPTRRTRRSPQGAA